MSEDDIKLYVEDSGGDGRPVILIHGWPLSGASWSEQTGPLKEAGFRVVTYDRRGFGQSDKPEDGYDYDALAQDLHGLITRLELDDVTLVGFSMGGGEVARYAITFDQEHLHSVVFAAAVPPYLHKTDDNPDGPLDDDTAQQFQEGVTGDREAFFDGFVTDFYSVDGEEKATPEQHAEALKLIEQADQKAIEGCMDAFATTDFREDLPKITVPTLVIHGDSDAVVPFEGSGKRTHEAIEGSELVVVPDAPHGLNVTHAEEFNSALLDFLK